MFGAALGPWRKSLWVVHVWVAPLVQSQAASAVEWKLSACVQKVQMDMWPAVISAVVAVKTESAAKNGVVMQSEAAADKAVVMLREAVVMQSEAAAVAQVALLVWAETEMTEERGVVMEAAVASLREVWT